MTYQKTVDEFNIAAADLHSYAIRYPSSLTSIIEHLEYWVSEFENLKKEAA